jgi:hypothetical protein
MIAWVCIKGSFFRLLEQYIKIISNILSFLYGSFSLTRPRIDGLTGDFEYDSSKIVNLLHFKFKLILEERFYNFSIKVSYDN